MVYSEKWLDESNSDPVKARQYYWHCVMNAKRMAGQYRRIAKRQEGNTTDFDVHELPKRADHLESFAQAILENLELLVSHIKQPSAQK